MKKYFSSILCVFGLASLVITSCKHKDDECINCVIEGAVARTVVVDTVKGTSIEVYPVFTPSNHPMCDSLSYNPKMGAYVYPYMMYKFQKLCSVQEARDSLLKGNDTACPCRKNLDSTFNDEVNAYFRIGNIEKFPYNRLIIKTKNDTTKLGLYTNYDNKNNLFIGEVPTDMSLGYYEYYNTRALAAGVYSYELVFYKEEQHATQIGDTVKGNFAIIRSDKNINVHCKNEAYDKNDPLLKE
ncbi:MAG: hypothetical protein MJ198_03195 [Bacteroidales bacterium]|nr:hypothetical protein [Bacteroidales bacterium]